MSLTNATIGNVIENGGQLSVYCHNYRCHHHAVLDMMALRDRLGPDHGAMHDDLVPKLRCSKCGSKKVGLIYSPGTKEYRQDPYTNTAWGGRQA